MKASRALITFAFIADRFGETRDIGDGLVPLFAPIADQLAGKLFDPAEFAECFSEYYGMRVHPLVIKDQVERLKAAGLIREVVSAGEIAVAYECQRAEGFDKPIGEEDVEELLAAFGGHAKDTLAITGVSLGAGQLQDALMARLIRPEFLDIILKPRRNDVNAGSEKVLRLPKSAEKAAEEARQELEAKLDIVCADFITKAKEGNPKLFGLIVGITSGALLAEVVLTLRSPGTKKDLSKVTIYLDSPFLMDALDLGHPSAKEYANELLSQLAQAKASIATYSHCIDEMRGNLRGALNNYHSSGSAYGPTGRRLNNLAFNNYVSGVITTANDDVIKLGVRIAPQPSATLFTFFNEREERELTNNIGSYFNDVALQRDAASIAFTLRNRRGAKPQLVDIATAGHLFVTENGRLAEWSANYLRARNIVERDELPPCITDRYLAGVLWMMLGGRGKDLSMNRLLANCASAMAPRQDVVAKMHQFLKQLDETRARYFEALITDDRAAHYLMRRTLGDPRVITQSNALDIYEEVFIAAGEKAAKAAIEQKEKEYAERDAAMKREMDARDAEAARKLDELQAERMAAEAHALEQRTNATREIEELQSRHARAEVQAGQEKALRLETEKGMLMTCLHAGQNAEKSARTRIAIRVVIAIFVCQVAVVAIGGEWGKGAWISFLILLFIGASTVLSAVGFWTLPDQLFGGEVRRKKREAFEAEVERLNAYRALESFRVLLDEDRIDPR